MNDDIAKKMTIEVIEKYSSIKEALQEFFELNQVSPRMASCIIPMFLCELFLTANAGVAEWDGLINYFKNCKEDAFNGGSKDE